MIFNYQNTAGIKQLDVVKAAKQLRQYFGVLERAAQDATYGTDEASLYTVRDSALRRQVKKLAQEITSPKTQEVMVVGIGGSCFGTKAVYEAVQPGGIPLSFYDTVHSRHVYEGVEWMKYIFKNKGEIIVNLVSKSGTTNEPVANGRVIIGALKKIRKKDWNRFVVVTTEPGSKLDAWAKDNEIPSLPNPPTVGGRYSVFCAVGIFPLHLAGIDIDALHKGARETLTLCVESNPRTNMALQSAVALLNAAKKGMRIENLFVFNPDLEGVGKWYRQLLSESLGKEHTKSGKLARAGITPIVSIGSVDLHSTAQLYLGGPQDKFTTFVSLPSEHDMRVPNVDAAFKNLVPAITNPTLNELMAALYTGTKETYKKRGLRFAEVALADAGEQEIGALLMFKMVQTMLMGRLLGVNAFDQPAVEEYKMITRRILSRQN